MDFDHGYEAIWHSICQSVAQFSPVAVVGVLGLKDTPERGVEELVGQEGVEMEEVPGDGEIEMLSGGS